MLYTDWIRSLVARCLLAMADPRRMPLRVVCGFAMIAALMAGHSCWLHSPGLQHHPNNPISAKTSIYSILICPKPDPSDGRRGRKPTGLQSVRNSALCVAVQPRHVRIDATPLNFQIGYYTAVAGLGQSPGDVVINGSIDVYNQCFGTNNCTALVNFWRSLSNLTINVTTLNFGCYTGEFWAVSQASPMRRVLVNGLTTLIL